MYVSLFDMANFIIVVLSPEMHFEVIAKNNFIVIRVIHPIQNNTALTDAL